MDAKGGITLWSRSLQHGLRYLTFIGDGDNKAFDSVTEAKPYGAEYTIQKSDCIGHVQKRMGTNLRNKKSTVKRNSQMDEQLVVQEDCPKNFVITFNAIMVKQYETTW